MHRENLKYKYFMQSRATSARLYHHRSGLPKYLQQRHKSARSRREMESKANRTSNHEEFSVESEISDTSFIRQLDNEDSEMFSPSHPPDFSPSQPPNFSPIMPSKSERLIVPYYDLSGITGGKELPEITIDTALNSAPVNTGYSGTSRDYWAIVFQYKEVLLRSKKALVVDNHLKVNESDNKSVVDCSNKRRLSRDSTSRAAKENRNGQFASNKIHQTMNELSSGPFTYEDNIGDVIKVQALDKSEIEQTEGFTHAFQEYIPKMKPPRRRSFFEDEDVLKPVVKNNMFPHRLDVGTREIKKPKSPPSTIIRNRSTFHSDFVNQSDPVTQKRPNLQTSTKTQNRLNDSKARLEPRIYKASSRHGQSTVSEMQTLSVQSENIREEEISSMDEATQLSKETNERKESSLVDRSQKRMHRLLRSRLDNLPEMRKKIVRIFTSSTFTDTSLERNSLMMLIYPKLQDFCRRVHGLQFQVVDMRWGVRDEATDDHLTASLCLKELENCKRLSVGPNFVAILGQKYGYRPFPPIINYDEYADLRSVASDTEKQLLDKWFKKDTNNSPPLAVLQPISSILINYYNKKRPELMSKAQSRWWDEFTQMQNIFRKASTELYLQGRLSKERKHNYFMSVTEREVEAGILQAEDTDSHIFCYLRTITGINTFNKNARFFIDIVNQQIDEEAQNLMDSLKTRVVEKMADNNIARYSVKWIGEAGLSPQTEEHVVYGEEFCSTFYTQLTSMIDRAMENVDPLHSNPLYSEVLQHLHLSREAFKDFQGREDKVEEIVSRITNPENRSPVVVYGQSGCGKTSLLGYLLTITTNVWPSDVDLTVVVRFLGTSPDSSSLLPFLLSVCSQICYVYGVDMDTIPKHDVTQLCLFFRYLLRVATVERPIFIIFDSLDQLFDGSEEHSLSWLLETLPPYVTMVVSVLSDNAGMLDTLRTKLANGNASDNFVQLDALGCETSMSLISSKLSAAGRDLTSNQWKIVKKSLSKNNTPLYVKMIYNDLVNWRSYQNPTSLALPVEVRSMIFQLLANTEKRHGRILVRYALSYMTESCNGIGDGELEDLLSLEDIVLNDVYQYHVPPIRRIPPLLWTRIRSDLEGYLSEREVDGTNVISWYHRQFREAAISRYLHNAMFLQEIHSAMADYFLGRWAGVAKPFRYDNHHIEFGLVTERESEADRMVQSQPLVFGEANGCNKRHFNLRRLNALPIHLLQSGRFAEYYTHCIFNFAFLRAKVEAVPLNSLLRNFHHIIQADKQNDALEVRILLDTLRLSASTITKMPNMLASQIIGRLLPHFKKHSRLRGLIQQCDDEGINESCLLPSFHCFQTPGGALEFSFEDHDFAPFGLAITKDERFLISASTKIIICDAHTGDTFRITEIPELKGLMLKLAHLRPDQLLVAYTNRNQVIVYMLSSGDYRVFENVIPGENLIGCSLLANLIVAWSSYRFVFFTVEGVPVLRRRIKEDMDNYTFLDVVFPSFVSSRRYQVIFKCYDSDQMLAIGENDSNNQSCEECRLLYHDAITFSKDLLTAFACTDKDSNDIHIFTRLKAPGSPWTLNRILPNEKQVFALTLSKDGNILVASLRYGYRIWKEMSESETPLRLKLPYGVGNLPVHVPDSYLVALTHENRYLVTAVRNRVYVFCTFSGVLLKTLVGHFGRILRLVALHKRDRVVTSSLDRKVNIWNIKDIMGQVFHIDKMEKPVKELLILREINVCMARTHNEIGFWCLRTGSLLHTITAGVSLSIIGMTSKPDASIFLILDSQHLSCWRKDRFVTDFKKARRVSSVEVDDGYSVQFCTRDALHCLVTRRLINHYNEYEVTGYDLPRLNRVFSFMLYCNGPLMTPAINPKRKLIAFALVGTEHQHHLQVHNLETGRILWHKKIDGKPDKTTHVCTIDNIMFLDLIPNHLLVVWSHGVHLVDIRRRIARFIPDWNGMCVRNGSLGLHAPYRGSLEILELHWRDKLIRKTSVKRSLISKESQVIFSGNNVKVFFTPNERHVVYTLTGHRTVRVFRVEDGQCVGVLRCNAPVNDVAAFGNQLVMGMEDAGVLMATIADPKFPDSAVALKSLPSRQMPFGLNAACDDDQIGEDRPVKDRAGGIGFRSVAKVVYLVSKFRVNKADSKICSIM